jgi:hypothetical protein
MKVGDKFRCNPLKYDTHVSDTIYTIYSIIDGIVTVVWDSGGVTSYNESYVRKLFLDRKWVLLIREERKRKLEKINSL